MLVVLEYTGDQRPIVGPKLPPGLKRSKYEDSHRLFEPSHFLGGTK